MAGESKIVNVPMADGRSLRFRAYADGAVYEMQNVGQKRVRQEPFRSDVFDLAWGEDEPELAESIQAWSRWPAIGLVAGLSLIVLVHLLLR